MLGPINVSLLTLIPTLCLKRLWAFPCIVSINSTHHTRLVVNNLYKILVCQVQCDFFHTFTYLWISSLLVSFCQIWTLWRWIQKVLWLLLKEMLWSFNVRPNPQMITPCSGWRQVCKPYFLSVTQMLCFICEALFHCLCVCTVGLKGAVTDRCVNSSVSVSLWHWCVFMCGSCSLCARPPKTSQRHSYRKRYHLDTHSSFTNTGF